MRLADLAKVLEDVDAFFTAVTVKIDTKELSQVIVALVIRRLKVFGTQANIQPSHVSWSTGRCRRQ